MVSWGNFEKIYNHMEKTEEAEDENMLGKESVTHQIVVSGLVGQACFQFNNQ